MILRDLLDESIAVLKNAGIENSRLDSEVIIASILGVERFRIITDHNREMTAGEIKKIRHDIKRRSSFEPVAYITGKKEFYSLEFEVNRKVLVPRPETEAAVDLSIYYTPLNGSMLDIGTGSGAIAIASKYNRRDIRVTASDISAEAIKVARRNAKKILGPGGIKFIESDLFDSIPAEKYSLIVSNPPYIGRAESFSLTKDIFFEPDGALFAEENGLMLIKKIISGAKKYLADDGVLVIEIGSGMKEDILKYAALSGFRASVLNDHSGLPRIAVLC